MYSIITPTTTLISVIVFFTTMLILFPIFEKITKKHVGDHLPDTTLRYKTEDLYKWAEEYGKKGRKYYIVLRFTYDLLFPFVYGLFLFITIGNLVERINSSVHFLAYIPLLGMTLDYIENILASILMARYPKKTKGIDAILPPISFIKRITVLFSFLLLLLLGIIHIIF